MPKIFISYRRNDTSPMAGRIYDRLSEVFGSENVFKDTYSIQHGDDFWEVIQDAVNQCDVLLVLIGDAWASVEKAGQPRLHDPEDFVRLEVEAGLTGKARVIPVLIENTVMPSIAELPDSLHKIPRLDAARVRYDPDFENDVNKLALSIGKNRTPSYTEKRSNRNSNSGILVVGLIALILFAVAYILFRPQKPASEEVFFLIDRSVYMSEAVGDQTAFDATIGVISGIVTSRQLDWSQSNTWFGLRQMGGSTETCDQVSALISAVGREITVEQFVEPLTQTSPSGNTAYSEGFKQVINWVNETDPNTEKVLFVFVGSNEANYDCRNRDRPDYDTFIRSLNEANVSHVLCSFTFFDDEVELEAHQALLDEYGVDCRYNIEDEEDIERTIDLAIHQIQQARAIESEATEFVEVIPEPNLTPFMTAPPETDDVELRAGPGQQYDVSGTTTIDLINRALEDEENRLQLSEDGNWLEIRLLDGTTGWISVAGNEDVFVDVSIIETQLSPVTMTPTSTSTAIATSTSQALLPCVASVVSSTGGLLNQVHVQPSGTSPLRTPVQQGAQVTIINTTTDFGVTWYQIEYENSETGWIEEQYIEISSQCPESTSENLLNLNSLNGFEYTDFILKKQYFQCYQEFSEQCEDTAGIFQTFDDFDLPLVSVSWASAQNYCSFIGADLPTLDELENIRLENDGLSTGSNIPEFVWIIDQSNTYADLGNFGTFVELAPGETSSEVGFICVRTTNP